MVHDANPEISVVLVTADGGSLRRTLAGLRQQTIRGSMEVVIPAQDASRPIVDEQDLAAFHSVRIVPVGEQTLLAKAVAAGVRETRGLVVSIIEDHCFPESGWAESLLRRHREGHAVVGPVFSNANPDTALSWCSFLMSFGAFSDPLQGGVTDTVASHNSSYQRDVLIAVGEELDELLEAETILHWQLREAGHTVYLEPMARVAHINPSRLRSFLAIRFHSGRSFAGVWSRHWSWIRRIHFATISPMIALRRIWGVFQLATRHADDLSLMRVTPLMVIAVLITSLGYMTGFLFGAGNSHRFTSDLYFNRATSLCKSDLERDLVSA